MICQRRKRRRKVETLNESRGTTMYIPFDFPFCISFNIFLSPLYSFIPLSVYLPTSTL